MITTLSVGATGGVCLDQVDYGREEMESLPRLGLGTINIAPLLKD